MTELESSTAAQVGTSSSEPTHNPTFPFNSERESSAAALYLKAIGVDRDRSGPNAQVAIVGSADHIGAQRDNAPWSRAWDAEDPPLAVQIGLGDQAGNFFTRSGRTAQGARRLLHDQQFISLNKDMLAVGGAFKFVRRLDSAGLVSESYHLTQHKPWEAHQDSIGLVSETYRLTVISGYPSTPPRHASMVRHPEGVLLEWDPPSDQGSGPIVEYRIFRGPSAGAMVQVATVAGDARHWFDEDAPPSVYLIVAYNNILESDPTWASEIVEPDPAHISLRDALTGDAWTGLPYAGWMGVRAIRLTPPSTFVLLKGAAQYVVPAIFPADSTWPTLAWSSSRPDIATVSPAGLVIAISPGRAVITAASTDGTHRSASVAVVVVPRLMVDDVRDHLQSAGFTHLFTRALPDIDRCIALMQLAGEAPDRVLPIDRPILQVTVRSRDPSDARQLRREVHEALHMAAPLTVNGTRYYAFEALSSGEYTDKDRRGPRYVHTLSFRVERQRTISEVIPFPLAHSITQHRASREQGDIIADLVRQELDLYGFNVPVYVDMLPDDRAEMSVCVEQRVGSASDRAVRYEFPRWRIRTRAWEPRVAELLAQLLHYRLHLRDYLQDEASGLRIWTLLAAGSPQRYASARPPRHEWEFEITSMMDR